MNSISFEMELEIFSYLDPVKVGYFGSINKQFLNVSRDQYLWSIIEKKYPIIYKPVIKYLDENINPDENYGVSKHSSFNASSIKAWSFSDYALSFVVNLEFLPNFYLRRWKSASSGYSEEMVKTDIYSLDQLSKHGFRLLRELENLVQMSNFHRIVDRQIVKHILGIRKWFGMMGTWEEGTILKDYILPVLIKVFLEEETICDIPSISIDYFNFIHPGNSHLIRKVSKEQILSSKSETNLEFLSIEFIDYKLEKIEPGLSGIFYLPDLIKMMYNLFGEEIVTEKLIVDLYHKYASYEDVKYLFVSLGI